MEKMKTFFIVPGFKMGPKSKQFTWLAKFLRSKGFRAVIAPITWTRRTNAQCAEEFVSIFNKEKTATNYVLGFSYGAVIALMTANTLKPKKIFLCSLSPDFKEDMSAMKTWIRKYIGVQRLRDSKTRSGRDVAKALTVSSVIFYGTAEGKKYPQLAVRAQETAQLAKRSKLVAVPDAPHQIDHHAYQDAIRTEIEAL
ncbi:MAG: hypothetical protein RLZZ283_781 [Candidatus Parcubacteria bacterium]|jgi:pimeloyl-ACP methyl ester carboxylesterase